MSIFQMLWERDKCIEFPGVICMNYLISPLNSFGFYMITESGGEIYCMSGH